MLSAAVRTWRQPTARSIESLNISTGLSQRVVEVLAAPKADHALPRARRLEPPSPRARISRIDRFKIDLGRDGGRDASSCTELHAAGRELPPKA